MEKCTRAGCGATYDPSKNDSADCHFHPGSPLFHDGLKSYTCCNKENRPVLSFDDFLKIPGCATGTHSSEKSEIKTPVVTANVSKPTPAAEATATPVPVVASTSTLATAGPIAYTSRPASPNTAATAVAPAANGTQPAATAAEEQDPPNAQIPEGTACKRQACKCSYDPSAERTETECTYHPLPAIFHDSSKGYACCKRRVLEFDEFMKIEGCKKGKHLFVGQPKEDDGLVQCRSDMYQTPTQVIASVFGKQADRERSKISFSEWEMSVELYLPSSKRFIRTYNLYGPILPEASSYRILGTKVEVELKKADGRSWPSLEASAGKQAFTPQITFGVQGRTGSTGAKDMIYKGDVVHSS